VTQRTVTVRLRAVVSAYLREMKASEQGTKKLKHEIQQLEAAGWRLTKSGLISSLAGIPGLLSPAAAALTTTSSLAIGAGASLGTLLMAVNGTGAGLKAVADGDAKKLNEALAGLTDEGKAFIQEYRQIKGLLDEAGRRTQDPFFHALRGDMAMIAEHYAPTLLVHLPRLSRELGLMGHGLAQWAVQPDVVGKFNRQIALTADLTKDWLRAWRALLAGVLDLADGGEKMTRRFVGGIADSAERFEKWVNRVKSSGELTRVLENSAKVMRELGELTTDLGSLLWQTMGNPALANAAGTLLDVMGLTLQVVRALLTAFEALPPGMQSFVATALVIGGAVLIVTGRIVALRAALLSVRLTAAQTGTALKGVSGMLAGPWGLAITAGIAMIGAFAAGQHEAKAEADQLRDTLDKQTGALTRMTRQQVAQMLADKGVIDMAKTKGHDLEALTNAVLAGDKATGDYIRTISKMRMARDGVSGFESDMMEGMHEVAQAVDAAQVGFGDLRTAMGETGVEIDETTGKIKNQISALQLLADTLKKQSDPVFALISAQQGLRDAQKDYDEAVKEHGRTSQEAKDAAIDLAKASVELTGAVAEAGQVFNGQLTPEMLSAMQAAGLTTAQIRQVEQSFKDAAAAGTAFAGTYEATIKVNQLDAAIKKARELRNLLGSFAAAANVDGEYVSGKRWGGITLPARHGRLRDAQVYSSVSTGARYAFAEPATKGEAFVPKNGSRQRSLGILDTAAGWYGHTIAPMGGNAGGGGGVTTIVHRHEHHHTLTVTSRDLMSGFRQKVKLGGGNVQDVAGSRPGS
jgi:hypothetical protein